MNSEKIYHTVSYLCQGVKNIMPSNDIDKPFLSLNHSIKQREGKELRFSKCSNCGRVTAYRLRSLKGKRLTCKNCKKPLTLTRL